MNHFQKNFTADELEDIFAESVDIYDDFHEGFLGDLEEIFAYSVDQYLLDGQEIFAGSVDIYGEVLLDELEEIFVGSVDFHDHADSQLLLLFFLTFWLVLLCAS